MPSAQVRILLVDDDEPFVDMLQKTLVHAGYALERAHNGTEALRLYEAHRPDIVLTDLIMPDMEGIELIIELRRRDPGTRIIAMTGGGRISPAEYLASAKALGAAHTLPKPFSNAALFKAIETVLAPPKG